MMKSFGKAFKDTFLYYEGIEGFVRLFALGGLVVLSVTSWLLIYFSFSVKASDWEMLATVMIIAGILAGIWALILLIILVASFVEAWRLEASWQAKVKKKFNLNES